MPSALPSATARGRGARGTGHGLTGAVDARGFDGWLAAIGDGDGLAGFRAPMFRAIAAYAAQHHADGLLRDQDLVYARIAGAMAGAPKKPGRGPDLDRYLAAEHFGEMVCWIADRQRSQDQATEFGAVVAAAIMGAPA